MYYWINYRKLNYGCHIGHKFVGALAYADDLILISPSITGLQSMINLCETFSSEFSVTFNEKKTECIKFGKNQDKFFGKFFMGGAELKGNSQLKYLDYILNSSNTDGDDITYKPNICYSNVNKLLAYFNHLPSQALNYLFQGYFTCFYGSSLWNLLKYLLCLAERYA